MLGIFAHIISRFGSSIRKLFTASTTTFCARVETNAGGADPRRSICRDDVSNFVSCRCVSFFKMYPSQCNRSSHAITELAGNNSRTSLINVFACQREWIITMSKGKFPTWGTAREAGWAHHTKRKKYPSTRRFKLSCPSIHTRPIRGQ